ncbi:acyl-CoA thioesterase domain-containing protein [Nonomuraea cavernae]|uniref:Acyl-CoA thioesterase-like N-terminal HotDog domain-containing protein n=1 Tax=Nonomuraea cavernae TaxID=2045107 RepID=A0A917YUP8_9ACTN|nr:hypothetical protein GCM10012289_20730 [Nonomuraea cavernae]
MTPPGALLRAAPLEDLIETGAHLRGSGGVHGGLTLALLTTAMAERAPGALLQNVTARCLRPLGGEFRIEVPEERTGRTRAAPSPS